MKLRLLVALVISVMSPGLAAATTAYDIDFKLNNSLSYDSIDISINYSAANGDFTGSGSTVSCTANAALNSIAAFNEVSPVLKAGIASATPIAGPVVLFTCVFDSNGGAPSASNFVITLRGWESTSTTTAPALQISRIQVH